MSAVDPTLGSTPDATLTPPPPSMAQQATRLVGALGAVGLLQFVQLYLITVAIRNWMAGEGGILVPAALCSLALFAMIAAVAWWTLKPTGSKQSRH